MEATAARHALCLCGGSAMRIGPLLFSVARTARPRWSEASDRELPVGSPPRWRLASITAVVLGVVVFWLLVTALAR